MSTWKQIPGWEGYYEVSDDGRVRSSSDYVSIGNGGARRVFKAGPVATAVAPNGYVNVVLQRDGRKRGAGIHRLMAEAFYGPPPGPWHHARHLDGDRTNNTVANIAWGSPRDNALDTLRHGRHEKRNRTHCTKGHPYDEVNTLYRTTPGREGHRECLACRRGRNEERRAQRAEVGRAA